MKKITIILADDHTIVREGFHVMLATEADFQIVGEAGDGRQAVTLAKKLRPDVVLMDIAMPHLNGLEATRQLLKVAPTCKVIILSAHDDDAYVTNATESGAVGFLLKHSSAREVCQAIRKIMLGETHFSPTIARRLKRKLMLHESHHGTGAVGKKRVQLTRRESEVLQLIAEGKANKQTAAELGISIKTVEKHRQHLMEKLDIHDTAGLTRFAISTGVIESRVLLTLV